MKLTHIFKANNKKENAFLTKVFGAFSEEIIECCLKYPLCEYKNLGRPTIYFKKENGVKFTPSSTLDFLFQKKTNSGTGNVYLVEQKSLFSYDNGNLLCMSDDSSLVRYDRWSKQKLKTKAWEDFLNTKNIKKQLSKEYQIKYKKNIEVEKLKGNILIWGKWEMSCDFSKRDIDIVLSIEDMINDMHLWDETGSEKYYTDYINSKQTAIMTMFKGLLKRSI